MSKLIIAIAFAGLLQMNPASAQAQDDMVMTRPAALNEADLPPLPPPPEPVVAEPEPELSFDWAASGEGGYSRSQRDRVFVNGPAPEPIPDWALEEPVRYIAEMCRPGVAPEGEEIEACFTRVEHEVGEARRAHEASQPRPGLANCRTETVRSQDGTRTSSSVTCGNGDPAMLQHLLSGN